MMNLKNGFVSISFAAIMIAVVSVNEGCKDPLTPTQESQLAQTGGTILCVLEEDEIDDPALNALCNDLVTMPDSGITDQQKQIIQAHAAKRAAKRAMSDGGAK